MESHKKEMDDLCYKAFLSSFALTSVRACWSLILEVAANDGMFPW